MFFKLLKYDLSCIKNTFITMLATGLGIGIGVALFRFFDSEFDLFFIDDQRITVLGAMFINFGILAAGIISVIQICQLYHKNFFSDAGYLSLTLPIKRWKMLLSKILAAMFWFNLMMFAVVIFVWMLGYAPEQMFYNTFGGWFDFTTVFILALLFNTIALLAYSLFFFAITLGNSVIANKRVHMTVSVVFTGVLTSVVIYAISRLDRYYAAADWARIFIAERTFQLYIPYFGYQSFPQTLYFPWFMLTIFTTTAIAFFAVTYYLLKRKVSLK